MADSLLKNSKTTFGYSYPMMPLPESQESGLTHNVAFLCSYVSMSFKCPGSSPHCWVCMPTLSSYILNHCPKTCKVICKVKSVSFQGKNRRLLLNPQLQDGLKSWPVLALGHFFCLYFPGAQKMLWKQYAGIFQSCLHTAHISVP